MSFTITIAGNPIEFPSDSQAADWAPPIIQFAQAVEAALSGISGPGDISPQVFTMSANANTNVEVTGLQFSNAVVRGANIRYAVHRATSLIEVDEEGNLTIVYNPTNAPGMVWELIRSYTGDAQVTFTIADTGQISFSSTLLTGTSHIGEISFAASALTQ